MCRSVPRENKEHAGMKEKPLEGKRKHQKEREKARSTDEVTERRPAKP